jgi:hypothetical protein
MHKSKSLVLFVGFACFLKSVILQNTDLTGDLEPYASNNNDIDDDYSNRKFNYANKAVSKLDNLFGSNPDWISSLTNALAQSQNANNNLNSNTNNNDINNSNMKLNSTLSAVNPEMERYKNLTAFVIKSVPDICGLYNKVNTATYYFTPDQKLTINVFMASLLLSMRRKLISESQDLIEQNPVLPKTIESAKLNQILDVSGLTYGSRMCSYDATIRLNKVLKTLNSTQQDMIRKLYTDLNFEIQYELPNIYNEAFSSNYQQVTALSKKDPTVMQTVGDILSSFYKNVTQTNL